MSLLISGAPGAVVHRTHDDALGELVLTVLDVDDTADLDVVHDWVREPRAAFWGLGELSREELRELYRYVDGLETHHAFLLRRGEQPIALLQTYDPAHDPVGECYPVRDGDAGLHFFVGSHGTRLAGVTTRIILAFGEFLFSSPEAVRVVVEPDVRNDAAIARMRRVGFELGPEIDLEHKRAQLAFLERSAFEGFAAARNRPLPPVE
ncbi:GNAT family N-acetyltransferase [Agromyces seonyuensis]|uniref:Lysine N-acyltransferase MbtK n=1 Tax=Agromyces seonyuensis TaxID=2662446 RepID=A0A6I4P250_9MICO|nr:GNAT family N-acetyltransferase [Agromyces seonyuensis]MWB99672.1 GNAT family N-acetyltransferase [Agromyces seonyuensis]